MTSAAPVTIEQATEADIPTLGNVVAAAFLHLEPSEWLVPDLTARARILPQYFRLYVEMGVKSGIVYTTRLRDAVAIWLPRGSAPLPDYVERLTQAVGTTWVDRFLAFEETLDARHPTEPHHDHLAILAVRPPVQGHGVGTALLEHRHAELDRLRLPSYLEAANKRDRDWYCHRGYYDLAQPIILPDSGPAMFPMWRDAQPGGL